MRKGVPHLAKKELKREDEGRRFLGVTESCDTEERVNMLSLETQFLGKTDSGGMHSRVTP